MKLKQEHFEALRPYFTGAGVPRNGEIEMHCPLHPDSKRSASLNIDKGVYNCFAGCGGGPIAKLLLQKADWAPPPTGVVRKRNSNGIAAPSVLDDKMVKTWHMSLRKQTRARMALKRRRSLNERTIRQFELGWDSQQKCYAIPIRNERDDLINVRFYQLDPPDDRRKIWSVNGHGSPYMYPVQQLVDDPAEIIICEGEMDALLTIQHGFCAVTRTASAITWQPNWNAYFKGRTVYICHDMDKAGQQANTIVGRALAKIAKDVRVIKLPYEITEKHGKDLTDFWQDHNAPTFRRLMSEAQPLSVEVKPMNDAPVQATILDSFNAANVGKPISFTTTIKGRKDPGYSLPARVRFTCEVADENSRCSTCPLNEKKGEKIVTVPVNDPMLLEMMDVGKKQLRGVLKEYSGIACKRVEVEVLDQQSVEVVYGRPSVDAAPSSDGAGDYKTIKITSAGRHDTMPNTTVEVVGSLYPNPRSQSNEFLAWQVQPVQTSIDSYAPDADMLRALRRFQPSKRQTPLAKVAEIAKEMSLQVTHIYGRPVMHCLLDLAWHSALSFRFGNDKVNRGWLDVLIVGDTRTGKSEAAKKLSDHYGCGEIVSCESATYAGIVGGAQQMNGNAWVVTWGAIPLNDRRLVVLDECGGLTPEQIARMSSVRSSGLAEIVMIAQERTRARTRLVWLGNPRNGRMDDYTYGVQAIEPLIGNPEDIARFDLAMSVHSADVGVDSINRVHDAPPIRYDSESCHALIRWMWSRSSDQIIWTEQATSRLLTVSREVSGRYIEKPPLVQGANVRYKLARVATALAGRTFSCDKTFERLVVTEQHVLDAVQFIHKLYGAEAFGYADISADRLADVNEARKGRQKVARYLNSHPGLRKFLRVNNSFRRQDIEEFMDMSREQANGMINALWSSRMIRREGSDIMVEPVLHEILREGSNGNERHRNGLDA